MSRTPTENICESPAKHREHMCLLMEKGLTEEIRQRTTHAAFVCGNCGARANESRDLCRPKPL